MKLDELWSDDPPNATAFPTTKHTLIVQSSITLLFRPKNSVLRFRYT